MDAEYLDGLSRWAEDLEGSEVEALRAAGRAMRTLSDANAAGVAIDPTQFQGRAKGLAGSEVAELRAAGRAIRALCTENAALESRLEPCVAPERRRRRLRSMGVSRRGAGIGLAALVAVGGIVGVAVAARAAAVGVDATGPVTGAVIGAAGMASLSFSTSAEDVTWSVDGRPVRVVRRGDRYVCVPGKLAEGEHTVVVSRSGRIFASAKRTFRFTIDTSAPRLRLNGAAVVRPGEPLHVAGRVEPGARLVADGRPLALDSRGAFRLRRASIPRKLVLVARDAAGNSSRWRVPVTLVPRRPIRPIRAVHVTAYAWADEELRRGVLALARAGKINAVELDLKDESGEIGWPSGVPLAKRMGAQLEIYDLRAATVMLHRLGVRVIGRLVAFRDPIHAQAAWKAGRRNEVVQQPGGGPYSGYGGFTNLADPAVRAYNIDLAVAAARLGVDEILYDYVRRPDGPISSMSFPGLRGTPERAIIRFLAESRRALSGTQVLLGASVFGVAATRPTEVAQDIPGMARHVDYIAPMLYPSHWGPGEYGVADPNGSPYDIVRRSTADFTRQVRGTPARVVPWLQDFSFGRTYDTDEVRAQIRGARDAGADEFLLWDAAVDYTADALDPTARPALGLSTQPPAGAPMPVRLPNRAPAAKGEPARRPTAKRPLSGLASNELGRIPVVMHHMIRADRVGDYDQTPQEFRAELEYLWQHGYALVAAGDLVAADLDLPRGTTPVVLTFDDATTYQLDFAPDGTVKSETAVGIMLAFARTHPGFVPAGTFYVNRTPFGSDSTARKALRWLTRNGFELGNHTRDHIALATLSDKGVQMQIATGAELIQQILPSHKIRTLALPLGSLPANARLAVEGGWNGRDYGPYGVMLVGAGPAPSPYSKSFDPAGIPRIRTSHAGWQGDTDYAFHYWMRELERNPDTRYVADGNPDTITIPAGAASDLAPRFAGRARQAPE